MVATAKAKPTILPFLIGGVLLIEPILWLGVTELDYAADAGYWRSLRTGFWFILGQPMIMGAGTALGALAWLMARWLGNTIVWILMVAASVALLLPAIRQARPEARLRHVLGEEAMQVVQIERLKCRQSFNDGETYTGLVSGPPHLLELIKKHRHLEREPSASSTPCSSNFTRDYFAARLGDIPIPVTGGEIWKDQFLQLLVLPGSDKVYFFYVDSLPRPPSGYSK